MLSKELLGVLSIAFAVVANGIYFWSVLKGRTRPHAFSWIIWGLITGVTFFAQLSGGAGSGAWAMGVTSIICFVGAFLAVLKGERDIKKSDLAAFFGALAAILLWYFTSDPLNAVVVACAVEMLAFYPTYRKSWNKPHDELAFTYSVDTVKQVISLFAMETYSVTTVLYPAAIIVIQGGFIVMLLWRRAVLSQGKKSYIKLP